MDKGKTDKGIGIRNFFERFDELDLIGAKGEGEKNKKPIISQQKELFTVERERFGL